MAKGTKNSSETQAKLALATVDIEHRIYTFRGVQVMVDQDLADLYGVETRRINEQVKRNIDRFPERFMFQLTKEEFFNLTSQIATSRWGGRRTLPYVFTEQGVAMLATVLNSPESARISIAIMDAFVSMRHFIAANAQVFQRLDSLEQFKIETKRNLALVEHRFDDLLNRLEGGSQKPTEGIFFNGQIFDAYVFVSDLIRSAKSSILLIDNYIDESVFTLLDKRAKRVTATIYTQAVSKVTQLDLEKHNAQYRPIEIRQTKAIHDRFLIIDDVVYHIGASIKDLGKKLFAFSKMEVNKDILIEHL